MAEKLERLCNKIKASFADLPTNVCNIRVYLFGSSLHQTKEPTDLDLLFVTDNDADASVVRSNFSSASMRTPTHLLFMTANEESETNFVKEQGCLLLAERFDEK